MASFVLKKDIELGITSTATQIEGGELDNSLVNWFRCEKIKDSSSAAEPIITVNCQP